LGEGFSWLADSLSEIAESVGWEKKIHKDLNKIRMLSNRLVGGVREEGVNLALLYIPGLSRYHIRRLVGAGYKDENSLRDVSGGDLGKLIPRRLVQRIQKRMKEDNNHQAVSKEKSIVQDGKLKVFKKVPENYRIFCETCDRYNMNLSPQKMNISEQQSATVSPVAALEPLLEISQLRSDRIIFEGKEFKVTTIGFSLLYLLAQHREKVVSYEEILKDLWKGEKDAIYTRINYHICKIRKEILKIMDKKEDNKKKIENIFKAIPGRGLMLNIKEEELEIN
jgi:helicase